MSYSSDYKSLHLLCPDITEVETAVARTGQVEFEILQQFGFAIEANSIDKNFYKIPIDLTQNETFLLDGELGVTPTYHETLTDAEAGTNPIQFPDTYTNTNIPIQTIYVRVTNDITGCFAIVDFDVIVNPLP